jgi:hypothetical protein
MTYYNTNKLEGKSLKTAEISNRTQDMIILEAFKDYSYKFSAHAIWDSIFDKRIPLTSVRRSLTNLTNEGKLRKTDCMVMGIYGKQVHTWKLA